MLLLPDFHREVARLLKLIDYTLSTPGTDKTDVLMLASRVLKMTGPDPLFTKQAHRCANACLLWGYYGTAADEQALNDHTYALLKAFNLILQNK